MSTKEYDRNFKQIKAIFSKNADFDLKGDNNYDHVWPIVTTDIWCDLKIALDLSIHVNSSIILKQ